MSEKEEVKSEEKQDFDGYEEEVEETEEIEREIVVPGEVLSTFMVFKTKPTLLS